MTTTASIESMHDLKEFALSQRKGVCWKTVGFGVFLNAAIITTSYCALTGVIPLWAGMLINSFWMIQGYTPAHECVHRNVHGTDQRYYWLNYAYGVVNMGYGLQSYTLHETSHRLHHAHPNDPDLDAEHFVARARGFWQTVLHCYLFYFSSTYKGLKAARRKQEPGRYLAKVGAETAVIFSIPLVLALMGYGLEVLMLWIIPGMNSWAGNAFRFIWLPHRLIDNETEPMKVSRVIVTGKGPGGRLLAWLFNFHNFHLIHHLYPYAPWHSLERIYEKGETVLKREGALVDYV